MIRTDNKEVKILTLRLKRLKASIAYHKKANPDKVTYIKHLEEKRAGLAQEREKLLVQIKEERARRFYEDSFYKHKRSYECRICHEINHKAYICLKCVKSFERR